MKKIYLDNGATTPVDKNIMKAMIPYFSKIYGNAMSLHSFGEDAKRVLDGSRNKIAEFFGSDASEIIFTSGATESNNLAIKGFIKAYLRKNKQIPHIITSAFEHHCILDSIKSLEREKIIEASYVKPGKDGIISTGNILKSIKSNTVLVSIMYVNNEIGTEQPISEIGKKIKKVNPEIIFHTDATQAVNYFNCNVDHLNVDMLSMSAHKIYGPKGIGMLYVRKGVAIDRIQDGGDHEFGKRAGTQNIPGIVGLAAALSEIKKEKTKVKNNEIINLRNYLIDGILKEIPGTILNGSKKLRSPNNANFIFSNVEGESLILLLNKEGIAASTGSACSSGTLEPSHVLLSIGLPPEKAHGSLRLTLGRHTTKKEIEISIRKIRKSVSALRKISGDVLTEYYKDNKKRK